MVLAEAIARGIGNCRNSTSANNKYLHLCFPGRGTCRAAFSGTTTNATVLHRKAPPACAPGAELLFYTSRIPLMQYPASWLRVVQEENILQNLAYLLLCSCFDWLHAP